MTTPFIPQGPSPEAMAELQTQAGRVQGAMAARRLWQVVLSEGERERLGNTLEECYERLGGTLGMWMKLQDVSKERAVIDLARALGFLDEPTCSWLLREMSEYTDAPASADRPSWDPSSRELRWQGRVIRRCQVRQPPTSIQEVLDAFQHAGWKKRIANPLRLGSEQLHQTLRSLNHGLKKISFHAQGGATKITWSPK